MVVAGVTWKNAHDLIARCGSPFALKDMSIGDAWRAIEVGASAVILSPSKRQLHRTATTLAMLLQIASAIVRQMQVLQDSGMRRRTRLFKALARTAKGAAVGELAFPVQLCALTNVRDTNSSIVLP